MLDAENLKIKIKTKAHENNLEPQDIMQMYTKLQNLYAKILLGFINTSFKLCK